MRLIAITPGWGIGQGEGELSPEAVLAVLAEGAEVLVRERALPEGLPLSRLILHVRTPGAMAVATSLHASADVDIASIRRLFSGRLTSSAHTPEEAGRKRAGGAEAVFLSPIFAARHGRPARGVERLDGHIALGGVTPENAGTCYDAGAIGIAVMGGIFSAGVTPSAARERVVRYRVALADRGRPQMP